MLEGYYSPVRASRSLKPLIAFLLLLSLLASLLALSSRPSPALSELALDLQEFDRFINLHNKHYASEAEYFSRFQIFLDNLAYARGSNQQGKPFTLGATSLADLSPSEFKSTYSTFAPKPFPLESAPESLEILSTKVDWFSKGAVTPVKTQGTCNSCWAFSATGALESAWFIKHQSLISLSEQQLIDCSSSFGNSGCSGGYVSSAFDFVYTNGGIGTEADYPYTGTVGTCSATASAASLSGYKYVTANSSTALKTAVAQQPVAVMVDADPAVWPLYTGGTVTYSSCGNSVDHYVLVVGYDLTASPQYFNIKNSWGTSWGNSGYIQLAYQATAGPGTCGMYMYPIYPVVN
jgi:KDEL-tailed cysteine endopeptidase